MSAEAGTAGDDGVLAGIAFRRDIADPRHDLLRAFRAGDREALERVAASVRAALDARTGFAPAGTLAVAVPGHLAGSENVACAELIRTLAPPRGWIVADAGTLRRVADAPEGKAFGPRDVAAESATLAWAAAAATAMAPRVPRILLVDDVVASGASLRAALAALPPEWRPRTALLAAFRSVTG